MNKRPKREPKLSRRRVSRHTDDKKNMNNIRSERECSRVAKGYRMRETRGSGCTLSPLQKMDFGDDGIGIEHKTTKNKSYSLNVKELAKAFHQANRAKGRATAFVITFEVMRKLFPGVPEDWTVIPTREHSDLLDYIRELEDED